MLNRLLLFIVVTITTIPALSSELSTLEIFSDAYPKSIYFRNAENSAANPEVSYESWSKRWSKLGGMVVKALDEEIPGRSGEAQTKFLKYKQEFPNKLMLLHFNGNARDPRFDMEYFQHQHWTYFVGTSSLKSIPKKGNKTTIKVANTSVFRVHQGKRNKFNDDIAIVARNSDGTLNWDQVEQVKLLSINKKNNSITIKRGQFGTAPLAFGKNSYLAPHVAQAPLAPNSKQSLWRYNFAMLEGTNNMALSLADNLLHYFEVDGELASFDGVEFDVLADIRGIGHHSRKAKIDYNYDGKFDENDRIAQNQYRVGVNQFLTELRQRLGTNKLIMADGNELNQQRAFGILNGIESESWPSHWDPEVELWSSGINRHSYWNANSYQPSFSYFKIGELPPQNGLGSHAPANNFRRLRIAGALIVDAVVAPAYRPEGLKIDNWPELTGGKPKDYSWLGASVGEPEFIGANGYLRKEESVTNMIKADSHTRVSKAKTGVMLASTADKSIGFEIKISLDEPGDLVFALEASINNSSGSFLSKASWLKVSEQAVDAQATQVTWLGENSHKSRFYFKNLPKGSSTFHFLLENNLQMNIRSLAMIKGPEIVLKRFENGFVIANPSRKSQTVRILGLEGGDFSKVSLRNNKMGKLKSNSVIIPAKDAAFYKKLDSKR
ncbi:hypothetical protein MK852_17075 [Shewanella benthica]|uniref:hypothetical protein n=1 Tax=Shewanella benthica TaxID=43661 RepID=UPI00187ABEFD|nr:hypothetical protein [Shewanella benthica]MBE7213938.1 hypothetical protein [Shewanella benthica]MCL1063827.1 hypothetical protein [Shewanella benthica]